MIKTVKVETFFYYDPCEIVAKYGINEDMSSEDILGICYDFCRENNYPNKVFTVIGNDLLERFKKL